VFTTAPDLARLGADLMRDRTILTEASYAEMTDFNYPVGRDEPMVQGYGLGLMIIGPSFLGGRTVWGHGGNAPGYAAALLFLPAYDAVVGILDNTWDGQAMNTMLRIFEVIEEEAQGG